MARKKKGLPFVVQPRLQPIIEQIGTPESGIIEIERRGYLSVSEKMMVEQATSDMSDQAGLLEVLTTIATEEGCSVSEVFDMLQEGKDQESLLQKYAAQIATVTGNAQAQLRKVQLISSTALIMGRVDQEWTIEESMNLHPDILEGLHQLYQDEDARSLKAFEGTTAAKEGDSKKQSADGN